MYGRNIAPIMNIVHLPKILSSFVRIMSDIDLKVFHNFNCDPNEKKFEI